MEISFHIGSTIEYAICHIHACAVSVFSGIFSRNQQRGLGGIKQKIMSSINIFRPCKQLGEMERFVDLAKRIDGIQ